MAVETVDSPHSYGGVGGDFFQNPPQEVLGYRVNLSQRLGAISGQAKTKWLILTESKKKISSSIPLPSTVPLPVDGIRLLKTGVLGVTGILT